MTGENAVEGGEAVPLRRVLSRGEPGRQTPLALEALVPELVHLSPPGGVRAEPALGLLAEGGVLLHELPAEARVLDEGVQALCGSLWHRSKVSAQILEDGRAQYSGVRLHSREPPKVFHSRRDVVASNPRLDITEPEP